MLRFREWIDESGTRLNWERSNSRRRRTDQITQGKYYMPAEKPKPSYAITKDMIANALKNAKRQRPSRKPVSLAPLPPPRSVDEATADWKKKSAISFHNERTNYGVYQHESGKWNWGIGNPEEYLDFRMIGYKYPSRKAATAAADTHHSLNRIRERRKRVDEAVIKLGAKKPNPGVDGFMRDFHASTTAHPFDSHARLHGMTSLEVSKASDHVHLHDIRNLGGRGEGNGTRSLRHLTSLADKHGVDIRGIAKAYSKNKEHIRDSKRLGQWYSKHGFEVGRGNKDDGYDLHYKARKS